MPSFEERILEISVLSEVKSLHKHSQTAVPDVAVFTTTDRLRALWAEQTNSLQNLASHLFYTWPNLHG